MVKNLSQLESELLVRIGNRFKVLRLKAGYKSYEGFALEHNLDRKQYWRVENGSNVTMVTIVRLLQIHQVSFEEFFREIEKG